MVRNSRQAGRQVRYEMLYYSSAYIPIQIHADGIAVGERARIIHIRLVSRVHGQPEPVKKRGGPLGHLSKSRTSSKSSKSIYMLGRTLRGSSRQGSTRLCGFARGKNLACWARKPPAEAQRSRAVCRVCAMSKFQRAWSRTTPTRGKATPW